MTAHITRCTCTECVQLDRLPARRQGIPGAFQTTFDVVATLATSAAPRSTAERPQSTAEALPLFVGALDPVLF